MSLFPVIKSIFNDHDNNPMNEGTTIYHRSVLSESSSPGGL